jgi:hypothetical protein
MHGGEGWERREKGREEERVEEREGERERKSVRERGKSNLLTICDYKGSLPYVHNVISTSAISSPYSNLVPLAPVLHHSTAHFI